MKIKSPTIKKAQIWLIGSLFLFLVVLYSQFVSSAWTATLNNNLSIYFDMNNSLNMINNANNNVTNVTGAFTSNANNCIIGNCMQINGSLGGKYKIINSSQLLLDRNFSFSFWFYMKNISAASQDLIIHCTDGNVCAASDGYIIISAGSQTLSLRQDLFGTTTSHTIKMNYPYMITYVLNSSGYGKIYINGTKYYEGQSKWTQNSSAFMLGSYIDGTESFNGTIDEFGIWNRLLSDAEVTQLYNSGSGITYNLVGTDLASYLSSPVNYFNQTYNEIINLNCSAVSSNYIKNISLYTDISGTLAFNQTSSAVFVGQKVLFNSSAYTSGSDFICDSWFASQTFRVGSNGFDNETLNLVNLSLYVARALSTPRDLSVSIVNVTPTGKPNMSTVFSTGFIPSSSFTGSMNYINVTSLTPTSLEKGKMYAIVINTSSNVYCSSYYGWGLHNAKDIPDGEYYTSLDSGTTWTNYSFTAGFIVFGGNSTTTYNTTFPVQTAKTFNWTCFACDYADKCIFATENRTINTSLFSEIIQNYTNPIYEGTTTTFSINFTYPSSYFSASAWLSYNGTNYTGTQVGSGDSIQFIKTLNLPLITSTTNYSFYWVINVSNSTGSTLFNSKMYNQTVLNFNLDNCTTYTNLIYNFTMKDERTQNIINGTIFNNTIEAEIIAYNLGSAIPTVNVTQYWNNTFIAQICTENFTNGTSLQFYVTIRYAADAYSPRHYYLQNSTVTNASLPQNINLFDLRQDQATKFTIVYKDEFFAFVPDALILVNKKYISEAAFKTVEVEKSDEVGTVVAYLDLSGVIFQFVVMKDGVVLSTFNNINVYCEDIVTGNCNINLVASRTGTGIPDFNNINNTNMNFQFNSTSRTATLTYATVDGSTANISLIISKLNDAIVCANSVTSTSGSLTCSIPSTAENGTYIFTLARDGMQLSQYAYELKYKPRDILGNNTVFLILALMLTLPLLFIPSAIGVLIAVIIGFFLATILLFLNTGGLLAPTSAVMWLICVIMILIWKMTHRGED